MAAKLQTAQDWKLTIAEFNTATWGNPIGDFKLTDKFIKRYNIQNPDDPVELQRVFDQLGTEVIQHIIGKAPVIKAVGGIDVFPIATDLRYEAYYLLAEGLLNDLFEKRSVRDISGSNLNISNDVSGWVIPADNISTTAWERLETTGIMDYEIIDGVLYFNDESFYPKFANNIRLSHVIFETLASEGSPYSVLSKAAMLEEIKKELAAYDKGKVGDVSIDAVSDVADALNTYDNGGDIILTDGTPFNKAGASAGEILFFTPSAAGTQAGVMAEEYRVNAGLDLVAFTTNNIDNFRLSEVESDLATLENDVVINAAKLATAIQADGSVLMNAGYTPLELLSVTTKGYVDGINTQIRGLVSGNTDEIEALKSAQVLEDKVSDAVVPFVNDGADLSAVVDQNGDTFDFASGKRFEVYVRHTTDNVGVGHAILTEDSTGALYVLPSGARSDSLKVIIDVTGKATATITNGNASTGNFEIYRILEAKAIKAVSLSYSKAETDNLFQKILDPLLTGAEKNLINVVNSLIATTAQLGSKKVSGGDLLSTAETLATEKFVTDREAIVDLTNLTTQDEIYNAVVNGDIVKIKSFDNKINFMLVDQKNAVKVTLVGFTGQGSWKQDVAMTLFPNNQTGIKGVITATEVGTPTEDVHATTKKYVDDAIAAIKAANGLK